ncbi:hypothetical protein RCL1_001633 [Eukaryota sp. TZLM3-RCL]
MSLLKILAFVLFVAAALALAIFYQHFVRAIVNISLPKHIFSIICFVSCFYLLLFLFIIIYSVLFSTNPKLYLSFFYFPSFNDSSVYRQISLFSLASALIFSFFPHLAFIRKSAFSFDFVFTTCIIHYSLTLIFNGFPASFLFYLVFILSAIISWILSQHITNRFECLSFKTVSSSSYTSPAREMSQVSSPPEVVVDQCEFNKEDVAEEQIELVVADN